VGVEPLAAHHVSASIVPSHALLGFRLNSLIQSLRFHARPSTENPSTTIPFVPPWMAAPNIDSLRAK
jgi:hypothetical protein